MKKRIQVLLVAMLAIATSVSMSACAASTASKASSMESSSAAVSSSVSSDAAISSEETVSSKDVVSSEGTTSSKDDSSEAVSKAASLKLPSLEEFVKMPIMQSTIKSLTASMAKQGIKFDLSTDGNKMIYTYTYPSNVKLDAKKMNSKLEQQASTFQNMAATLKQSVSTDNLVVVVRYLDSNKKVIVSKEFPAN